ncbi:conserved hypothetical protein, phage tail-like region [Candidatus Methanoperedens nitroreducens]|uniref:Uncharacterized protein n=1 Tax=Candidatus Methanoperedens nitratireducens TaxID=1392998 RepID=A0A062UU35_9EURY|nr:putative baseplate assembly protein [Candidatus Methanoperedens nitroreducens]KCZ70546.1 conserved hypothetical protein, phage tail-like region [Candidatus Methanoperedens nitroreducens]MDJ1420398.1 putative baseplate assembly protein [Candidatus Methanoperedens sp.]
MSITPPRIDSRDQQMLVKQVRELALYYCPEWKDLPSIESDKQADALIHIFSRMVEIIIQRLNKVPDKNFLTFLDMVGVQLLPPRIAKAALTFTMAKGDNQYKKIPSRTQVATAQTKEQEALVFETAEDLTIIQPGLIGAVSLIPDKDKWTDHSTVLFSGANGDVELFRGKKQVPHRLYLGHSKLFSLKEKAVVTLDIEVPLIVDPPKIPQEWEVKWYYFDETLSQKPLNVITSEDLNKKYDNKVANLLKSGSITFEPVAGISERTLTGFEKETGLQKSWTSHWILAELSTPIPKDKLPVIKVKAAVGIGKADPVSLSAGFFNNAPLDMTRDFYPFGEKPKFNETYYIYSKQIKEVFSKVEGEITITVTLSQGVDLPDTEKIKLFWELWNGKSWEKIGETTRAGVPDPNDKDPYSFKDTTNAFTRSGIVKFKCPIIKAADGDEEQDYWVRVRIVEGGYGSEAAYEVTTTDVSGTGKISSKDKIVTGTETKFTTELKAGDSITAAGQTRAVTAIATDTSLTIDSAFKPDLSATGFTIKRTGWIYKPPTYKPPSISTLTLEYDVEPLLVDLDVILSYNDFVYRDYTKSENYLIPFQPVEDKEPALYLSFDKDIATLPVTLFFPLIENVFAPATLEFNKTGPLPEATPPVLAWEYWNGKSWSLLSVEDGTKNLIKREFIKFLAPGDLKKKHCFEFQSEYYWIRARLDKGEYANPPRLRGIYTNTVWAYNHVTVNREILGSSNGKINQVFNFSHYPVLPGQKILVREISLTGEERRIIRSEEGKDAIEDIKDDNGNIIGYWVRWHEVNHFYSSGPHSRHYSIDRNNGTVIFGDGKRGMIPPAEKNNIICSYQYGGGDKGNSAGAQTITKLRTSFPFVESVTNNESADGGGNSESLDRVRERGPQTIKHRDRAVTYEDFEWLVREASPRVARVKCLPTTDPGKKFQPGWITMIIVPDERDSPKPVPTRELIDEIEKHLFSRSSTYLADLLQINLIGPGYIQVGTHAKVHFTSITDAKIIEGRIIENLNRFFHPLIGGQDKKGWDFGKAVHISEVYEVIEDTEGVDYVKELHLKASAQIYRLELEGILSPSSTYQKNCKVESDDGKIAFSLSEKLISGTEIDTLTVSGFKEGDHVAIHDSSDDYITTVVLRSVSDNVLECEADLSDLSILENGIVKNPGGIKSYISSSEKKSGQSKSILLTVATFGAGDKIIIRHRTDPASTESAYIKKVNTQVETIFVEDNYLVYSGAHIIEGI